MPRKTKPVRLWLKPADPKKGERSVWVIKDGTHRERTGCGDNDRAGAEAKFEAYLATRSAKRHKVATDKRHPSQIPVSDVLNLYLSEKATKHARPGEAAGRVLQLNEFFGDKMLSEVNGPLCREYVAHRGKDGGARRDLEDLRAAINYHRKEGYCSEIVGVSMPDKGIPRERWLTRSEAARLIWAAWRYREVQKGQATDRRTRRHVAKFILVALYTGTRAGAVCGASLGPAEGRGWVDLDRGVFYRRAPGTRQTKKRQPAVRLPKRLLAHMRRWSRKGQRYVVEWNRGPVTTVKRAFAACVEDAKLGDGVIPHTLRHTAATWQMQAGTDLHMAAGFLGMTVQTLERVYAHHHPDHQQEAVDAIDRPNRNSVRPNRNSGTKADSDKTSSPKIVEFANVG